MISLETAIASAPKINRRILPALKRLGIAAIRDLLFHFPSRYEEFPEKQVIADIVAGERATIVGAIQKISERRTAKGLRMTEASVSDASGIINVIWFNQPFLARTLKVGDTLRLSGKIARGLRGLTLQNPSYEKITRGAPDSAGAEHGIHTGGIIAIYPETEGMTSRWLRFLIKTYLPSANSLTDPLPQETRTRHNLPEIREALRHIHFPESQEQAAAAERRFIFEELLLIQLRALRERSRMKQRAAPAIPFNIELIKSFVLSLPFHLTDAQRRAIWEIGRDMARPQPMNRLLEGDVGSGKTVVAAAAALLSVRAGFRVAYMAPTEILARQHFATFNKILELFHISIGLRTASEKKTSAVPDIIIGTHALLQKNATPKNLGLVIIDEQHRFGVSQRSALARGQTPTSFTQTSADELLYQDLTYKIRECIFKVKDAIGSGHKETVYQKALAEALTEAGLQFERERRIPVIYGKKQVGSCQPDFIVEEKVIVELKALPFIGSTEIKQAWNYIKGSPYTLLLFVNFGPNGAEIRRIIYDTKRSQHASATQESPRMSALGTPHFLSMTATPIPRTLALTIYGDLDISLLDEMPKNRKSVITKIISADQRSKAYRFIRDEVLAGRQVFVICPRIEITKPETYNTTHTAKAYQQKLLLNEVKTVTDEYKKLSEFIFPDLRIAMLHGKMKSKEKVATMKQFHDRGADILVSTSVIEVGVDVSNATIMMIEGAERFGLAQLHQFRGRVGRGAAQSYCFLFPTEDGAVSRRLRAVVEAKNGFELAEKDLAIRGPGDLFGDRQWGEPGLVLKGITDSRLVRAVREEAMALAKQSPDLAQYPALASRLAALEKTLHLE
ncbi:MAG: GxxExxY protein [Candidatus Sungiibacteriota bacterium]